MSCTISYTTEAPLNYIYYGDSVESWIDNTLLLCSLEEYIVVLVLRIL